MNNKLDILCLGASYGSLLATKLAMAGHDATLVCLPQEAERINLEGTIIRMPIRGLEAPVEIRSRDLPGRITACGPGDADPAGFDLCALAMQEPQFRQAEIRRLLARVAASGLPCLSIMNMPPLPFLRRLPGLDADSLTGCYTDATVWDGFDPGRMSLCSPDPQAFRPPEEPVNLLVVRLPTNFKAAPFADEAHTALLRQLEADIGRVRWPAGGEDHPVPVKLRVHDSLFVPLAKWCMLLAGNYRCILPDGVRPIREAVLGDRAESREVYEWVAGLCRSLGADDSDLVPFDKYAAAADSLITPSSAARALAAGVPHIERVDRLVQSIGQSRGLSLAAVDRGVATVDAWLEQNRAAAAKA